jgi:hypothetical protein
MTSGSHHDVLYTLLWLVTFLREITALRQGRGFYTCFCVPAFKFWKDGENFTKFRMSVHRANWITFLTNIRKVRVWISAETHIIMRSFYGMFTQTPGRYLKLAHHIRFNILFITTNLVVFSHRQCLQINHELIYRIWGSHKGGYEEFYLLGCNAV